MTDSSAREESEALRLQRGVGAGYPIVEDDRVEEELGERRSLWDKSKETGSTLTVALRGERGS